MTHLDADALADLHEGLLAADRAADARAHLERCPECRAVEASLRAVPASLAAAAEAGAMPADVVARVDDALSRAGRDRVPSGSAAAMTVTPLGSRTRRSPVGTRLLQAAAAVVLVLAVVGVGASVLMSGGGGASSGGSSGASANGPGGKATYALLATGADYSASSLAGAVPRLVAGEGRPFSAARDGDAGPTTASSPAEGAVAPDDTGRLAAGAALADCVTALADAPAVPLAVDLARYEGKPAAVIVLPGLDDPAMVDVWVVGPGCRQGDDQFRFFTRVARPAPAGE